MSTLLLRCAQKFLFSLLFFPWTAANTGKSELQRENARFRPDLPLKIFQFGPTCVLCSCLFLYSCFVDSSVRIEARYIAWAAFALEKWSLTQKTKCYEPAWKGWIEWFLCQVNSRSALPIMGKNRGPSLPSEYLEFVCMKSYGAPAIHT